LLAGPVISGRLPVSTATLVGVSVYALLRQVRNARPYISCVTLVCFGNDVCLSEGSLAPDALLRKPPAESSRGALKHPGLGFSARASGFDLHRRPPPPNNSFKPTPCRGIGHVLYATLAHVRRPATGRLNSGVRRQKSVWWLCFLMLPFPASVGTALRSVSRVVASSVKSVWRAHTFHALR
jgi:hypothetical protein